MSPSLQYLVSQVCKGDKIASIGCNGGLWEVMLGFEVDGVTIHLQDIDTIALNEAALNNTIAYFEKQYSRKATSKFDLTIGTETNTNLPKSYFDFVLINNSLHEFSNQKIMLQECRKVLKYKGKLVIEEQMAKYKGELHEGCGKALFTKDDLIQLAKIEGFFIEACNIERNENMTLILV